MTFIEKGCPPGWPFFVLDTSIRQITVTRNVHDPFLDHSSAQQDTLGTCRLRTECNVCGIHF